MADSATCPKCGSEIPPGAGRCPWCEGASSPSQVRRETVLVLSITGLVILFVVTGFAVRFYHSLERTLAVDWYRAGEASLRGGDATRAVDDFRNALAYSRDNSLYRLRLAQALIAAHRPDEARPHLLNLWERQPGDGTVNLELARLAAGRGEVEAATRYYHNAIFGVWPHDPVEQRRRVRFELCEFLLARGLKMEAQAALIELLVQLPRDPALQARVGTLFLRAEDYSRAMQEFQQALRLDTRLEVALRGAGQAAFAMADYREARRYLERAVRANPLDQDSASLLETARQVLEMDPFEPRIAAAERARRAMRAYDQARKRLAECAERRGQTLDFEDPRTELQSAHARARELEPRVRERTLARDSDLLTSVASLSFEIEDLAARECGPPLGRDYALWLVARKRGGGEP
jgi:tetratricopeptide (TPR) repeat protein